MENLILGNYKIENSKDSDDKLYFTGYCCHFNSANLNSEIVDENSFNTFFEMYNNKKLIPIVNYNHDNNQIIGGVESIISDKTGLYMEAYLSKGVKINDEMIIPNVINGTLTGLSTEGYILDNYIEERGDNYYVPGFLLTAIAVTPHPADFHAHLSLNSYIEQLKAAKNSQKLSKTILFI